MPRKLKDTFFPDSYISELGDALQRAHVAFDRARFTRLVLDETWKARELKDKMRHITRCLRETLPKDYFEALRVVLAVAPVFEGFQAMVFCDFVECYGLDHWDLSLPALRTLTKLGSAEFAIRPFLAQDPERGMATVRSWLKRPRKSPESLLALMPCLISSPSSKRPRNDPSLISFLSS